jgi:hypothetical protein
MLVCRRLAIFLVLIYMNVKSVGVFEVKETSALSSEMQQTHYFLASKK